MKVLFALAVPLLVAQAARADDYAYPVATSVVSYVSGGGKITAGVWRPDAAVPMPGLLLCHAEFGGHASAAWWAARFAQLGYYVLVPDFRGQGQSEGKIELAGGEVDDALAALETIRQTQGVDSSKTVLFGDGHGAIVALLALARGAGVSAACVLSPAADLAGLYRMHQAQGSRFASWISERLGGTPDELPAAYERRSPIRHLSGVQAPVLLLHGANNQTVPPAESASLYRALKEKGVTVERHVFAGVAAAFEGPHAYEAFLVARNFLDRYSGRDRRPKVRFKSLKAEAVGSAVELSFSAYPLSPLRGDHVYAAGIPSVTPTVTLVLTPTATATYRLWKREMTASRTATETATVTQTYPVPAPYVRLTGDPVKRHALEVKGFQKGKPLTFLVTGAGKEQTPVAIFPAATVTPERRLPSPGDASSAFAAGAPDASFTPAPGAEVTFAPDMDQYLAPETLWLPPETESAPSPPVVVIP